MRASFTQYVELKFWDLVIPTLSRSRILQNSLKLSYPYFQGISPKVMAVGLSSAAAAGILLGFILALIRPAS
jgi:hypothetical protein